MVFLLEKMTQKHPELRFSTCSELLQAIDEIAAIIAPSAFPTGSLVPGSASLSRQLHVSALSQSNVSAFTTSQSLYAQLETDTTKSFKMSASGSIITHEVAVAAFWKDAIQLLLAISQQLELSAGMGHWCESFCESMPESLLFRSVADGLEATTLAYEEVPQALKMLVETERITPVPSASGAGHLLASISSTAGVKGAILLRAEGAIEEIYMPGLEGAEALAQHCSPLATLLGTLPLSLVGLECIFADGRVLIWKLYGKFLFVFASHSLNKTLLRILVWQHRDLLGASQMMRSFHGVSASGEALLPKSHDANSGVDPGLLTESIDLEPDHVQCLDDAQREQILTAFASYIGPMAKLMLKKESKKLGFSHKSIPVGKAEKLVKGLAGHLDATKKRDFVKKALSVLTV